MKKIAILSSARTNGVVPMYAMIKQSIKSLLYFLTFIGFTSIGIAQDTTGPTMVITAAEGVDGFSSNDATLSLTFTSSEATSNFAVGDITVSGGAISNFSTTSSTVYTATFTPPSSGTFIIGVTNGSFSDATGNTNSEFSISQTNSTHGGGGPSHYQTFTAIQGQPLDYIQVKHGYPHNSEDRTVYLKLYQGSGTGGTLLGTSNNGNTGTTSTSSSYNSYYFTGQNITLTSGQVYTWHIYFSGSQTTGWISFANNNPYSGGYGYYCCDDVTNDDFQFKIQGDDEFNWTYNIPPIILSINDLTINEDETGTVTLSATDIDGDAITFSVKNNVASNYLNFDGTSNWIQTKNQMGEEDHPIPDEGDFSVSVWARANAIASGLMEIYSQGKQPRNIYLGSSGPLGESKYIRAGDSWGNTGVAFPIDGMWHHYVIIKSSSNAYLYLDGELAATKGAAIDNPNPEGSGLYIGKQYSEGGEYFDGNIAELSVWDVELSATEIKTIYNSGLFLSPMRDTLDYKSSNNVTIYYSLNEGEGSTVYGKEYNSSEVFTGEIKGDAIWTKTVESLVTATISGSTLTLVPDANWHGEVNYTVSASDGYSASSTNFNLTVTPVQDAPYSFDWLSKVSDTIDITKDVANLAEVYKLEWTESKDVDGDTIDYLLYVKIGLLESEEIYDTTSTSIPITYQEFVDNVFEPFPMLPRVTVKFSVVATDGIDTVNVAGDDRVVFVNRYEYLSTEGEGIPTEFALHENYPNPFNPTTTLRFDLPEVSNLTLTIYNMLGQKVRTFNYQNTSAGYHSVTWDATNDYGEQVGAGVYLYQLQTKDFVKTRKMVLLK